MANAGEDAAVVLNRVREGKGTYGYNAASGEYGDMVDMGILDPTKVTRLALQNAASVAGLLLTTEVWSLNRSRKKSMHMARRAVAWAAWTCNTGFAGYSQRERASARSLLCARRGDRASRVATVFLLCACHRHYPGRTPGCMCRSLPQKLQPSPNRERVGF